MHPPSRRYIPPVRTEIVEMRCRSALNHTRGYGFEWTLNAYSGCAHRCAFCYVRSYEQRADRPCDKRYGTVVRAKVNVAEVLRSELERPSWKRDSVSIGGGSDPYQAAEGRYRLTRACLELLAARRNPIDLLTRGTLVVRDVDVLQEAARRARLNLCLSIPTLREEVWRRTEPGAPPPRQRLRALTMLARAGLRVGVAIAPVLPGLSDDAAGIAEVVRAGRDAGATHLWSDLLHLPRGTREHFLGCLREHWPALLPRYECLFAGRAWLPRAERHALDLHVEAARERYPLRRRRVIRPPAEPEQLALSI